jgi:hypothetical protein
VSFGRYLTTSHFGEATFENWESEFLRMGMYVVLTVTIATHRGPCGAVVRGLRSTRTP